MVGSVELLSSRCQAGAGESNAHVPGLRVIAGSSVAHAKDPKSQRVMGISRNELVTRHADLVKYVVGRLGVSIPGIFDHEDAMQVGVLGLLRAVDAYRPQAAASFETYAILRIRGAILDAVRSLDPIGRAGRQAARASQRAIRDLQHELGRSPTETEIAARLCMTVARYRESLRAASVVNVSLDEHDAGDSDTVCAMADQAPDPNAVDPAEEAVRRDALAFLALKIGRLGGRSRMVLALRYRDELTFSKIGRALAITESRASQIHTEAILALRSRLWDSDIAACVEREARRTTGAANHPRRAVQLQVVAAGG
jgi:RNA polymerase sigma factor FliA